MPVYNGEKYLAQAIDSILDQTLKDFEFLILNDGSNDNSEKIILKYNDSRIIYVKNDQNLGLSYTLNKGLQLAKGKYIARMDCDDVSSHDRFEKQANFLYNNPAVGIVGSWTSIIGSQQISNDPTTNAELKVRLLWQCALAHPTVMMNSELLKKFGLRYDVNYKYSQDYDLWARAAQHFELANIPEPLLYYRQHEKQMSSTYGDLTVEEPLRTRLLQIQMLANVPINDRRLILHRKALSSKESFTVNEFIEVSDWLIFLSKKNYDKKSYDEKSFNQYLYDIWNTSVKLLEIKTIATFWNIRKINFFRTASFKQKVFFFIKFSFFNKCEPLKSRLLTLI